MMEDIADAIQSVADAIASGLSKLGLAGASTPMGAIESHGKAILDASEKLAGSLNDIAEALDRIADQIGKKEEI
jgi:uncharacterized protein YukE